MKISKNDFIEIEFTGKIVGTEEVFDTNIKKDAEKAGLDVKKIRPFVLAIGHKMLPAGFDKDLEGKEVGKDYFVEIKPEEGFGKRDPQMVRMIPTKLFHEQEINPQRGMQLTLDGQLVKVLSSSGGRTLIDFNNPLAGKKISYDYKINKKIGDVNEKVDALQDFLFRQKFEFEVLDKKVIFKVEKNYEQFVKMFSSKFEEILGLKIESNIVAPKGVPSDEEKKKEDSRKEESNVAE